MRSRCAPHAHFRLVGRSSHARRSLPSTPAPTTRQRTDPSAADPSLAAPCRPPAEAVPEPAECRVSAFRSLPSAPDRHRERTTAIGIWLGHLGLSLQGIVLPTGHMASRIGHREQLPIALYVYDSTGAESPPVPSGSGPVMLSMRPS